MSKNTFVFTITGAIIVLICGAYYFLKPSAPAPSLTVVDANVLAAGIGSAGKNEELLSLLQKLNTITMDKTVLTKPEFVGLKDFGVTLSPEPLGRQNPFAPYGVVQMISQSQSRQTPAPAPESDQQPLTPGDFGGQ